ncbi:MAG: zf-HC2 domain-containing protein [Candidatus Bipolaricaulota bacterium]|nr:zf-HC2 domain-containing protein [Candidatus Bipolaricaulota bacterium]MDW8031740.1 zf-HC2 domain-containing protein [Candidatus Bipolaricaulota bacterium]
MRFRCPQELRELLPWYANGTLAEEERAKVEAHLARCAHCRRELQEIRQIKGLVALSVEGVPEPTEELLAQTVERIRSEGRHTIAQLSWQIFALGFSLGVLYERGRVKVEPEIEALGWELKRRKR